MDSGQLNFSTLREKLDTLLVNIQAKRPDLVLRAGRAEAERWLRDLAALAGRGKEMGLCWRPPSIS